LLEKRFENFWKNFLGDPMFSSSPNASLISNKFYDRNHTLQVETISNIVRID